MKNELGFSPECEALRLRREYLRGKCAEEVEEYMHLTTCVGPNLRADYMLRVGLFEHRVFQLNPDLPSAANELWLKIQTAYKNGDWRDLEFLVCMVDDVLKGRETVETGADALRCC